MVAEGFRQGRVVVVVDFGDGEVVVGREGGVAG